MVKPVRKTSNKNPPIFSHEFVIQNHADIVSCVAMVFVVGLMVQATSPLASIFITLQHNVTEAGEVPLYSPGVKDWACLFFYSLICIVIHAIIQEYVLDKISKKLHLSKSKLAVFTTSGQLSIFYLISAGWGIDIVIKENFLFDISRLWSDYPSPMPFLTKLYIIIQLAYNLHEIPELYFQRTKKEEYVGKATQSLAAFSLIFIPYFLNFNHLLVCLLVLHHLAELVFHIFQLVQTVDKDEKFSKITSMVSNCIQLSARVGSIVLAILTLWYGLALGEQKELDLQTGYFNTPVIRIGVLVGVLGLQLYLTFNIISQEIARSRESQVLNVTPKTKTQKKDKSKKSKKSDESDLPEVDQNTNKTLKKQKAK
ncbi:translocating chain-associated membrane protein 1 [Diorhabda carinulata]|uniref:translocating chain-associated membrane protein 1 n=1 Tax=Diorhabda sublineata TaxID=1163346 RepID=UPI0024E106BE|nr:translocating chain-associated membrane protein 1 [Diorhabda sublineata]XP_057672708.1 translocating chain-associated membrane protein 1 [Diorhabda carinulata]